MASMLNAPANCISVQPQKMTFLAGIGTRRGLDATRIINLNQRVSSSAMKMMIPKMSTSAVPVENPTTSKNKFDIPIMVIFAFYHFANSAFLASHIISNIRLWMYNGN